MVWAFLHAKQKPGVPAPGFNFMGNETLLEKHVRFILL